MNPLLDSLMSLLLTLATVPDFFSADIFLLTFSPETAMMMEKIIMSRAEPHDGW